MKELTEREWQVLGRIARNLLVTSLEIEGITRVCDTLIEEEVELLKKIAE